MWSKQLHSALKKASVHPYTIECHDNSADFRSIAKAINEGIDSHLEAIEFTESIGEHGKSKLTIASQSVPVLVRRLMESDDENSLSLASGICSTLGIELI